jgi:O-antigen/teichoic acid export membrane protein
VDDSTPKHSESDIEEVTSNQRLARNSGFLLIGKILPLVAAVFAIPWIIEAIGEARFGILAIGWLIMGYASMLDLGLGSAMVKSIADSRGRGEAKQETPVLFGTAFLLIVGLGTAGGLLLFLLSPWLVHSVLTITPDLQQEAQYAFYAMSLAIPISLAESGTRGLLEAHQKFGRLTPVHAIAGLLSYLGLAVLVQYVVQIQWLILFLVGVKFTAFLTYLLMGQLMLPGLVGSVGFRMQHVSSMMQFGGWMTAHNLLTRSIEALDRLLIGSYKGMKSVAYYATPLEIIVKMNVLPGAMASVLFPAFASEHQKNQGQNQSLTLLPLKILQVVLVPVGIILILWGEQLLQWWISPEFAASSGWVIGLLSFGIVFNAMAHIPGTMLQGIGRPDITAKLHMVELPLYLLFMWLIIEPFGIEGVAGLRSLRVLINCLMLMVLANVLFDAGINLFRVLIPPLIMLAISFLVAQVALPSLMLVLVSVVLLGIWLATSWMYVLSSGERTWVRKNIVLKNKRHN